MNEKGFTLLETLFALFVTSLTVLLLSQAATSAQQISAAYQSHAQLDWHIFLNQIEYDFEKSKNFKIDKKFNNNRIIYDRWYEEEKRYKTNSIEFYTNNGESMLRQRVNNKGHQPILMNVNSFHVSFEEDIEEIIIKITFESGESYEAYLTTQATFEEDS
jgi:competence protein ComGF